MRTIVLPAPDWMPLAGFVAAVLFAVALTVVLLVIARRSDWSRRR